MRSFHAARSELTLKVLFIGVSGSGKSSIVRALAAAAAAPVEAITDEAGALETTRCSFGKIGGRRVSLHCWEVSYERFIAPSARPNPLHLGLIFSGVHAAVLVFDALAAGGNLPSTAPAHVFKEAAIAAAVRPLEAVDDMVDAVHARLLEAGSAAVQPPVYLLAHKADTIASLAALRGAAASGLSGERSGSGDASAGAAAGVESALTGAGAPSAHVRLASPLPRGALTAAYAAPTQLYACGLDADALGEFCAGAGIRRWFWTSTVEGSLTFGPGAAASALQSGISSSSAAGAAAAAAAAAAASSAASMTAAAAATSARSGAGASSRTDGSRPEAAGSGASTTLSSSAGPAAQASSAPGRCSSSLGHFLSGLLDDCLQAWGSEHDAPEPLVQPSVTTLHAAALRPSSLVF